jgi:hypothetical protein
MPLFDHFHPPLSDERHWEGFHSKWANALVDDLNERLLPPGYFAEPELHFGTRVEIDAATFSRTAAGPPGTPLLASLPCTPTLVMPATFSDTFEVQIIGTDSGPTLVAAIELVSPGNKDRAEQRRAFAVKCASYLNQGISLIFVDIVTNRHSNLHNEIAALLPQSETFLFPANPLLYAAAYRPVLRGTAEEIDAWLLPLALGQALPILPLALPGDVILPVDLERTYLDACRKLRIIGNASSGLSS